MPSRKPTDQERIKYLQGVIDAKLDNSGLSQQEADEYRRIMNDRLRRHIENVNQGKARLQIPEPGKPAVEFADRWIASIKKEQEAEQKAIEANMPADGTHPTAPLPTAKSVPVSEPQPQPSTDAGGARNGGKKNSEPPKEMKVGEAGHHVPAIRKSRGRPFAVDRSDASRPTIHVIGDDNAKARAHWRMHDAERAHIGPRQGDFKGTDNELFEAYRQSYKDLKDIRVDVKSPDGKSNLGTHVTLKEAVDLIEKHLSN